VLGGAAHVVTVSDFNIEYLTKHVGLDRHRLVRIYNGLDLDRFACAPDGERPPRVISVGRFVPKKGLDDLIRACALLRDAAVSFECTLVGGGVEEGRLRALVTQHALGEHVHIAGALPQRDVIELVRGAAVFAAPCIVADDGDRDGLPTVLLESMALGTPVVSTDVVGIPEIVRDGDTGLLVPERDPARLATALGRILRAPALQRSLAVNARALIERDFDGHRNAATLRSLFASECARERMARAS
jgi:glycosyltransferase involved in cell wall biosynthesis